MNFRRLGNTGLDVSQVSLGTVELGMDYGFRDSPRYKKPDPPEAIRIIHRALDLGINLIDTARGYGSSEELIGRALREAKQRPFIASKVAISETALASGDLKRLRNEMLGSVDKSLTALQVETVDLMQIHNVSAEILASQEITRTFDDIRQEGKVRFLGASCTGEDVSLAALETGRFPVLQVPFNLLDRKLSTRLFPRAGERRAGILVRSAFLRGVLAGGLDAVPEPLCELRAAARQARELLREEVDGPSELALRFCLSFEAVSSVIIGVRSLSELESNVADAARGPLAENQVTRLCQISVQDSSLLDPNNWQGLI